MVTGLVVRRRKPKSDVAGVNLSKVKPRARVGAQRTSITRISVDIRSGAPDGELEVVAGKFVLTEHFAGFPRQHQSMIVIRAKRTRPLEHGRGQFDPQFG